MPNPPARLCAVLVASVVVFAVRIAPSGAATRSGGIGAGRWASVQHLASGDSIVGGLTIMQRGRALAGVVWLGGGDRDSVNVVVHSEAAGARIWFAAPTRSLSRNDRFLTVVASVHLDRELVGRWYREDGRAGAWIARPLP